MMLNKIPVLDKGYIGVASVSLSGKVIGDVQDTYFQTKMNKELWKIASATLVIKCPLFVQLALSRYDFKIVQLSMAQDDAYTPDISEINTGIKEDDEEIWRHLDQTMSALRASSKAYVVDKCDPFVAQSILPVSLYNEILVHGTLRAWMEFLSKKKFPRQIAVYRSAIEDVLTAEWPQLAEYKKSL
jgi:hypothetical protein